MGRCDSELMLSRIEAIFRFRSASWLVLLDFHIFPNQRAKHSDTESTLLKYEI